MEKEIRKSSRLKRAAATIDGEKNIPVSQMSTRPSQNPWGKTDEQNLKEIDRLKRMYIDSKAAAASGDVVETFKLDKQKKQRQEYKSKENIEGSLALQDRKEKSKGAFAAVWNKEIIINSISEIEILGITMSTLLHLKCRVFLTIKVLLYLF